MTPTFAPRSKTFAAASIAPQPLQQPSLPAKTGPRVAGLVEQRELSPGFVLQRMRVQDLEDRETLGTVLPSLKIGLVVGGSSDFYLGHQGFQMGPRQGLASGGMLVAVAEPDIYRRRAHRGREEHKLVLSLQAEWLEQLGADDAHTRARLQAFQSQHLARLDWQPSARALSLAHQIVHAPAQTGMLDRLYQEARALEIVAEALAALAGSASPKPGLSLRDHRRLRDLQARLDTGELDRCSLADIARDIGMSASGLQRAFKAFAGEGLFEYRRGRRLDAARQLLEREGGSVAQAAAQAGYGNAANFATAFKRRFACCPSTVKARG